MPVVLVPIAVLVLVLWVIAAALAISLIMAEIGKIFHAIPVVGGYIAGAVDSMAQGIANVCGKLEAGIDHLVGAAWHQFARYLDRTWQDWVANAHLMWLLAETVGGHIYDLSGLRSLVHNLVRAWHGIEHGIKELDRKWHGIEARVKTIERTITQGIGHDLRIQIKALEREVHGIEKGVIPRLRAGIKAAEGEVTQLENFTKAIPGTRYLDWATGIVTAALGVNLLNFFRCPTFLNKTLGRGCGFWNGLEDLLGLFVDTLLLANVCELIPILETAVSDVADPIVVALTDIGAGLCSGGIGPAPQLSVPALSLPANPGFSLNLP